MRVPLFSIVFSIYVFYILFYIRRPLGVIRRGGCILSSSPPVVLPVGSQKPRLASTPPPAESPSSVSNPVQLPSDAPKVTLPYRTSVQPGCRGFRSGALGAILVALERVFVLEIHCPENILFWQYTPKVPIPEIGLLDIFENLRVQ